MSLLILLALTNGLCIGLSRSLNGQLSLHKGPFKASFYNHIFGFLFLSLILICLDTELSSLAPAWHKETWYLFLGGVIGAFYVALNSYVLNQLGAMKAALLVISGQMVTGVLLDIVFSASLDKLFPYILQGLGIIFIILGVRLSQKKPKEIIKEPANKSSASACG
ncbi:MAG: DMT family transporter [Marinomonas sp.]